MSLAPRTRPSFFAALALIASGFAPQAWALESAPVTSPRATATLVTEADSYAPGKPLRIGLRLRQSPGWHTYWQNPGDAGVAPSLSLTGASLGALQFPVPSAEKEGTLTVYGYRGEVLISAPVSPPATQAGPLTLTLDATWLVCNDICVPEEGKFTLTLPPGDGAPGAQAALFAANDAKLPIDPPWTPRIDDQGRLWLEGSKAESMRHARFFPDTPGIIDHGAVQPAMGVGNVIVLTLPLAKGVAAPKTISGVLTLETFTATTSYRIAATAKPMPLLPRPLAPPEPQSAAPAPPPDLAGLLSAAGLALLGGLILNLMPCVLPVLAMKAMALARLGGAGRAEMRRDAALYALGILAAFAVLGGFAVTAAYLWGGAGWGTQFQSPLFTAGMSWLLLAIGLNLSGVFEIGAELAGAGQGLAARGSFFTGMLAVVVATPCTAPFMGTAIAAAVAAPPLAGFAIFLCLGIGLASPMLVLAVAPGIGVALLPRPGAWMATLRAVLAFPMYGAALWLLWVAAQQLAPAPLALVLTGLLLTGFAAFAFGQAQARAARGAGSAAWALAALASAAALILVLLRLAAAGLIAGAAPQAAAPSGSANAAGAVRVEPYSPARLAELRAAGTPVFVDATAAWCITCLVNEQVALNVASVQSAFQKRGVVLLRADWTRADPVVTDFLRAQGREGVPLYVVFPPGGAPRVLPQILTPALVIDAISAQ